MIFINRRYLKMKKTIQRLKNERVLTLVELLSVIVILAIIAVIAFVFIGGIIENSKKDAHIANAQQIISAAKLHEATGGEKDFTGEGMSVDKLIKENYLDEVLDPWTKAKYEGLENAKVTKEDNKLKLSSFNASGNCDITADELAINKGDRGDRCQKEE